MNRVAEDHDEDVESDDYLPDDMPRRRRADLFASGWLGVVYKFLMSGAALAVLLAFTQAVREDAQSDKALADVIALSARHERLLQEQEPERRNAAVLRREYDEHIREQRETHARLESEQAKMKDQLRDLERQMFSRTRP